MVRMNRTVRTLAQRIIAPTHHKESRTTFMDPLAKSSYTINAVFAVTMTAAKMVAT